MLLCGRQSNGKYASALAIFVFYELVVVARSAMLVYTGQRLHLS
jgi:hypothetical protein